MMRDAWLVVLLISILAVTIVTFYFLSPLLDGIIMGIVFAYVAKPIKKRIESIGNVKSALIATLIIVIPISILMFFGIIQGLNQILYIITHYKQFEMSITELIENLGFYNVREYIRQLFPSVYLPVQF